MSSSAEASEVVLRDLPSDAVRIADTSVDLRGGVWTRLGGGSVRGDLVTETTLDALAQRSRDAARAQGYAAGWAEGRRQAQERTTAMYDEHAHRLDEHSRQALAEQRSAVDALRSVCTRTTAVLEQQAAELASQAVELALEIAEAVVGHELAVAADGGAAALRSAAAGVPVDVALVARLNPRDLAVIDPAALGERVVTYVADESVARGDAVLLTEDGAVESRVGEAMARIREVLGR